MTETTILLLALGLFILRVTVSIMKRVKRHEDSTPVQREEAKEEAFEVVEYHTINGRICTPCYRLHEDYWDGIRVGAIGCHKCKHFQGHHVEGESIRCSAKK